MHPDLESIHERLNQAQQETRVVLTVGGRPSIHEMHESSPPDSCWEGRRSMDRYLDDGVWQTEGPGFQRLLEWVEVHWNPERERQPPSGAVVTGENWGRDGEVQLDAATAVRRLIAAARLYGRGEVGKYAAEFAAHGLLEVNRIYLLKGPAIEAARRLDEYCALLPYREARRKLDAESDPGDSPIVWPEPGAENVCALDCRYFERGSLQGAEFEQYASPLLRDGPERLALLLGLVWGTGFRVFGGSHGVPVAAGAALPYRHAAVGRGSGIGTVPLALKGYGPRIGTRPLPVTELHELSARFRALPAPHYGRAERASERLRRNAERTDDEDRAVDLGIALHILFTEDGEREDAAALIPRRAAWFYADSDDERRQTEDIIGRLCGRYSELVQGRASSEHASEGDRNMSQLLADTDNVVRACLKAAISDGLPGDWNQVAAGSKLRLSPPRTAAEIPSVKSDSLSWSVAERDAIDRALEAVWKPVVEEAPRPDGTSSMVGNLSPEFVERLRAHETPYLVLHPARLYMAHPKWPKFSCEPLDERARHYCEQDVERHVREWAEAAEGRGLVQLRVANDAELYHPSRADDWPRPLLSSHEEEANAQCPGQPATAEGPAVQASADASDAKERQPPVASETSSQPSRNLPGSAVSDLEREWHRLWESFQHDVNVATNSLLHILDGIHAKHQAERQRLIEALAANDSTIRTLQDAVRTLGNIDTLPTYPRLRGFPSLTGEPLFMRSAPGGPMEQLAFKGWISEVYDDWESRYRTQLKHETRYLPGAIRPRQPVLGDLRHIRNNLLHNGIARRGEAADCEILKWFVEGERMQLGMRHVFDFLNQMGWLHEAPAGNLEGGGKVSFWHTLREGAIESPVPALISVRPLLYPEQEHPSDRFGASVAFENGVFGLIPMGPVMEETVARAKERTRKWQEMTINDKGDLSVPGLGTAPAADIYRNCLKGEKRPGPGIWKPWVQFRE